MTTREVVLDGGSPWGFRLHGGADVNQPLRISRVNPGSKAALRGIREGDFITSINNQSTKDISNAEAHALLRNSGDTLKLGLNEDGSGSPKRRQYKTVHQETHSETVKKSSTTSYTVTSSTVSNDLKTSKVNGNSNGDPIDQTRNPAVSQRSTLSSTCSSISSTPSTSLTSPPGDEMADNAKSRRKRARNNRKKTKSGETIVEESEYCVESPKRAKSPEKKKPVKSRSLDDDDLVKIQELSEVSETEDKSECKAIVSEAESDVEWEVTETMEEPEIQTGTIRTLSLPLEEYKTEEVTLMSPEEELSLRNFLEGLNLVNSPEDAFRLVREVSTMESVKSRRARKRQVLEEYFQPMVQKPRFLDVINEETSDLSDREQPLTHHLKQGTPEPETPQTRPPKTRRYIDNPTILVGTKIIEVPSVTHEICSTSMPQSSSTAEVVYLEDSSNSTTPDPKSDNDNDDEKDTNDDMLSSTNSSVPDFREFESLEEKKQVRFTVKKGDVLVGGGESLVGEKWRSSDAELKGVTELTPPPTPDDLSKVEESFVGKKENYADAVVETVVEAKQGLCEDDLFGTGSSEDLVRSGTVDSRDTSGETEKLIEVKVMDECDKSIVDTKSSGLENPKEIQVNIEEEQTPVFEETQDVENKNAHFSKNQVRRLEFLKDLIGTDANTISESTSEDNLNKTTIFEDVDIKNKQEFEGTYHPETETQKIVEHDVEKTINAAQVPKEKIIKVELEGGTEDFIGTDVSKISGSAFEDIFNKTNTFGDVKFKNKEELEDKTHTETEKQKLVEHVIEKAIETTQVPKEKIIKVEIEGRTEDLIGTDVNKPSRSVFEDTFSKTNHFGNIEFKNKEEFRDKSYIEIEKQKFAEHVLEKTIDTPQVPKEKIIKVEIEGRAEDFTGTDVNKPFGSLFEDTLSKTNNFGNIEFRKKKEFRDKSHIETEKQEPVEHVLDKTIDTPQVPKEKIIKVEIEGRTENFTGTDVNKPSGSAFEDVLSKTNTFGNIEYRSKEEFEDKSHTETEKQKIPEHVLEKTIKTPPIPKEKIIKVEIEDRTEVAQHNLDKNRNILQPSGEDSTINLENPKERIIQIRIEDRPKSAQEETRIDSKSAEVLETSFQESLSRSRAPKEKIIQIRIDDRAKSVQQNTQCDDKSTTILESSVKESLVKSEGPKEKIIQVKIEDEHNSGQERTQVNIGRVLESGVKENFSKSEAPKERIIKVKIEEEPKVVPSDNKGEVSEVSTKDSFSKVEILKNTPKEKEANKMEAPRTQTNFTDFDIFGKSETSKEKIIEVKVQKGTELDGSTNQKPVPREKIIKVEVEDDHHNQHQELQTPKEDAHKTSHIPKETIIKVEVEDDQDKTRPVRSGFEVLKSQSIFKEVEIGRSQEVVSSPKIMKLDDMKPPTILTPAGDRVRIEKQSKLEERNIDIVRTEDFASPKILKTGGSRPVLSSEKYKTFSRSLEEGKQKSPNLFINKEEPIFHQTSGTKTEKESVPAPKLPPVPKRTSSNPQSSRIERQIPIRLETGASNKKQPESPSKEVESICGNLRLPESIFYSNVLSPPAPSPSPSLSSGSSSRATSLCTAKYNSMNSSIADITSIKDEELLKGNKTESPLSLRELCVNFLMAQPWGADVLQELADVSSSIEHLTKNLMSPEESSFAVKRGEDESASKDNLSPTRESQLDKRKKVRDEARKVLDLHEFIYRASYHDERQVKNGVEISPIKHDVSNRLLAIIRDAQEPKVRKFSTLPRNMDSARLKARDLSEWLQLARNKSRSELDLTDENSRNAQRRNSLPQDLYEQMYYLQEKEREIQRELEMLEEEKRKLATEMAPRKFRVEDYHISKKGDFAESKKRPVSMPVSTEFFRQQMYEEYLDKIAAREERKLQQVIKVSQVDKPSSPKAPTGIEDEFMTKVKEKQKLGKLKIDESDDQADESPLPKHIQEFMDIAKLSEGDGVWSPGQKPEARSEEVPRLQSGEAKDEPISPVWTPKSATSSPVVERKEFRPVKFESPVLSRKNYKSEESEFSEASTKEPPWKVPETSSDTGFLLSSTLEKRLPTSHSSPGFNDFPTRLPRAQNPTITLLQKAREGKLPKGTLYIEDPNYKRPQNDRPPHVGPGEILYKIKNEYTSESDSERPRKMADLGPRKYEGIGPTTKDGMPLILRSEVKDANQSKWYKKMYDTIHKQRPHRDEFVTVRYKQRRGQYPYSSGYLSEPEPGAYDSDFTDYKYATLDRRRLVKEKENDYVSSTMPRTAPEKVSSGVIKHGHDPYRNQPGRIENYIPGHSSISDKEAKEWWDEVMDIFDVHLEQQKRVPQTKSFINQALKESGYESDSTLVFRRRDEAAQQLSPQEQKEVYKIIQKGGDIPLHGLRKPAPERPKEPEPPLPPPKGHHGVRNLQQESPRKYVENEVTIHYKTPVRQEIKEYLSEDELAYRQAEAMKKIYQEERRRKYLQVSKSLQELQDMNNRRHTDNFIPSQKSPIPLNRYDDFEDLSPPVKPLPKSPEPRLMARALYNFVGQTARELTFRKGDLIYVRRQVDKNWYEGELNAMVGLFPVNYVEIITYDTAKTTPRKSHEGQARAKYNFVAQTHLELSLAKGELVVITRRVDDNWFEGKIGGRKGIFPVSYVDVLIDPSDPPPPTTKPVAAPAAHSLLLNGSAGGKESMGSHSYTPSLSANQLTSSYRAKPAQVTGGSYGSLNRGAKNNVGQALHIETQAEPVPYRALYKYLPQNDDELELLEGDTVYVLEKCDDGWYVGSSDRTGAFGTFPGNYVEKI